MTNEGKYKPYIGQVIHWAVGSSAPDTLKFTWAPQEWGEEGCFSLFLSQTSTLISL